MDLLRPWIGPYVHQVLTEAQQWKAQNLQGSKLAASGRYEDDGSNLRVKSRVKSDEEAVVQFTKIHQIESPIQVSISDSETYLKVTIAAAAAEQFERDNRRRITERTLGAVFQLLKFEVVVQHHGPKKTKVTMLIQELQHLGSDGSVAFFLPRPIECLEDIQELLTEFQALRAQGATSTQSTKTLQQEDRSLPSPSPACSTFNIESEETLSQERFATQAPRVRSTKRTRVGSSGEEALESHINQTRNTSSQNGENKTALNYQSVHKASDLGEKTHESGIKVLPFKLVESRNKANGLGNIEDNLANQAGYNQTSQPPAADELSKKQFHLLRLLDKKTKPKMTEVTVPAVVTDLGVIDAKSDKSPLHQSATSREPSITRSVSRGLHNQSRTAPINQDSEQHRAILDGHNGTNQPQRLPAASQGPASAVSKTNVRLRRKDILIPKNQKTLLDRLDAWYPPEPGQRPPTANIPIAILQDLNKEADRQNVSASESPPEVHSPRSPTHDRFVQTSSEDSQSNEEHSDSDAPFSSAQWPASQEQHGLPPDSSAEAAGVSPRYQNDPPRAFRPTENAIDLDKIVSSSQSRQSSVFLSSNSDMHPRKRLRRSKRVEEVVTELSSASEGANRRNPRRATRSSSPSTNHTSEARSPSVNGSSNVFSNEVHLDHRAPDAQSVDSKVNQVDASSLELGSFSKPLFAEPQSNHATKDVSRVVDTQCLFDEQRRDETIADSDHQHRVVAPDSASLESSLDITIPIALDNEKDFPNGPLITQNSASTDPSRHTVMQVERTPLFNSRYNWSLSPTSYSTANQHQPLSGQSRASKGNHVTFSNASSEVTAADTAESLAKGESRSHYSGDFTDQVIQNDEVKEASPHQSKHDGQFIDPSIVNWTADLISTIEETSLPLNMPNETHDRSTPNSLASRMVLTPVLDLKRKASEPLCLSPSVSKRRKGLVTRASSDTAFLNGVMQDPSVVARQSRSEFFANLKKSRNLTAGSLNEVPKRGNGSAQIGDRGVPALENIDRPKIRSSGPLVNEEEEARLQLMEEGEVSPKTQPPSNARRKSLGSISTPQLEEKSTHDKSEDGFAALAIENKYLQDAKGSARAPSNSTTAAEPQEPGAKYPVKPVLAQESLAPTYLCSSAPSKNMDKSSTAQDSSSNELPSSSEAQLSPRTEPTDNLRVQSQLLGDYSILNSAVPEVEPRTHEDPSISNSNHDKASSSQPIDDMQPQVGEQGVERTETSVKKNIDIKPEPKAVTIFEEFKAAYSDYHGNEQHFKNMCGKIATLLKADRIEHPSLWDDFIIRHKADYPTYLNRCAEDAQDPIPYEYFYRNHIEEPRYSKRIVTRKNLGQIIPSIDEEQESQPFGAQDSDTDSGQWLEEREPGVKSFGERRQVLAPVQREGKRERFQLASASQIIPARRTVEAAQKPKQSLLPDTTLGSLDLSPPYPRHKVIDLTEDDLEAPSPARLERISPPPVQSANRSRRSLPWSMAEPKGSSSSPQKSSPNKTFAMSSPVPRSRSRLGHDLQLVAQSPPKPRLLLSHDIPQPNLASKKPFAMHPPPTPSASSRHGSVSKHTPSTSATVGNQIKLNEPNRVHHITAKDKTLKGFVENWRKIQPGKNNAFATPHTNRATTRERSGQGEVGGSASKVNPFNFTLP